MVVVAVLVLVLTDRWLRRGARRDEDRAGCGGTCRRARGGKGVRGAQLKQDDLVEHFFTTTTHDWLLFFTNLGRVYRCKAHELPEANRDARGQHVANILAFQPDEKIAQVIDIPDYGVAPYLVLATRNGKVKKTELTRYDSPRSGGLIAINLEEGDELIGEAAKRAPAGRLVGRGGGRRC